MEMVEARVTAIEKKPGPLEVTVKELQDVMLKE